jgi:hypothetical protein
VLYTDITSQEVFFNVRLIGKVVSPDKVLTLACEPWHWRADMGGSSERILEQVGEVIIQVHQILVAFLADCYFLGINPHHEPRCLTTEVQKELSLLDSNKSLVAELRNARENLLNYLKELAIKEQIKYHLYEFARNAKNKIPTFYEYKVTSRHMFGYGYFALSTVLNRREKNRSIENFLNSDHGKGELPSEVNRRKMLIEEFWNSELPNIWSTMRNSVSNSEVKAKLPHPLPLCKVKVTVVTRADCGSDSIPNNRPGRPLIGPGSELFLEVTLLNTYYRVKAEPDIAQAIDEAVANVLKGVDTVSSEKGLRFGRLFFDGGKLGLK